MSTTQEELAEYAVDKKILHCRCEFDRPGMPVRYVATILQIVAALCFVAVLVVLSWVLVEFVATPLLMAASTEKAAGAAFEIGRAYLNLAIVAIGTAIVGLFGTGYAAWRSNLRHRADQRIDALQRTRAVHVRLERAQKILRSDSSPPTYGKHMRELMRIVAELEDIEQDVVVGRNLFGKDNTEIAHGLRVVVQFLSLGLREHQLWSKGRRKAGLPWLRHFTAGDGDELPPHYVNGLNSSKGRMRFHVYGTPSSERPREETCTICT